MLPTEAIRPWLELCGVTPAGDPAAYDYLQRAFESWWAAGGSARAFVAAHQRHAPADFGIGDDGRLPPRRPVSGTDAERALRRRWRPGYPDPFGG